jgi:hypothetical protein
MPTYFGYVEREADNYVNWAEVGKTITDTVLDINRVREEKKQLIDTQLKEELKKTALQPKGKDEEANRFISQYGDDASNYLLMQNRLLKQGVLSVKDYTNNTQNLTDNTDNLFKIMEDYNKNYEPSMERYKKQISSGAEPWLKSIAEGFANFNNVGSFIDTDGSVKLAKRELVKVDGKDVYKLNTNAGEMESISVLRNAVNIEIDRVDAGKVTTDLAKTTGKESRTFFEGGYKITKEGIVYRGDEIFDDPFVDADATELALQELSNDRKKTIEFTDAKGVKTNIIGKEGEIAKLYHSAIEKDDASRTAQEKLALSIVNGNVTKKVKESTDQAYIEFKQFETDMIRGALPTPESYMSVLFDAKQKASNGKQFEFKRAGTPEEARALAEKNPNTIYWAVEDGKLKPVLSKDQEEEAIEYMRLQLRGKYDQTYKEEEKAPVIKTVAGGVGAKFDKDIAEYTGQQNQQAQMGQYLSYFYNGTAQQKQAIASKFRNRGNIKDVLVGDKGISVLFKNGDIEEQTFYTPDGQPLGPDQFVLAVYDIFYKDKDFDDNTLLRNVRNTSFTPTLNYIREVDKNAVAKFLDMKDWFNQSLISGAGDKGTEITERVIGGSTAPAQGSGKSTVKQGTVR